LCPNGNHRSLPEHVWDISNGISLLMLSLSAMAHCPLFQAIVPDLARVLRLRFFVQRKGIVTCVLRIRWQRDVFIDMIDSA